MKDVLQLQSRTAQTSCNDYVSVASRLVTCVCVQITSPTMDVGEKNDLAAVYTLYKTVQLRKMKKRKFRHMFQLQVKLLNVPITSLSST
jgi:hypothetical protein